VDGDHGIIAGHGRLMAARKLGMKEVPVIELAHLTDIQRKALIIADNKLAMNAEWDTDLLTIELNELLADNFAMEILGFDADELKKLLDDAEEEQNGIAAKNKLSDKFLIPPFSILNAREGWWQDRKRAWLALGIKSEEGRGENDTTAAPGGSVMVAGYDKNGKRLVGLKNIGKSNG
jgi:hypothetical protein